MHLPPEVLEHLFSREADAELCIHGIRSRIVATAAGPLIVTRIVAHPVLEEVPEEDMAVGEESFLVMDLPLTDGSLALVSSHFGDTMDRMTETALERIITEDGETWPGT